MSVQKYPPGWNESRIRSVIDHYDSQTDEEAAAEIEAGSEITTMSVPTVLVPAIRRLIARRESEISSKRRNAASETTIRRRVKAKPQVRRITKR